MRRLIPYITAAIVVVAMIWQARIPEAQLLPDPVVSFPVIPGTDVEELGMTDLERQNLPSDTMIRRRLYRFGDGHWLTLSTVIGGRSKNSVHRPELCLPGQGYQMSDSRKVSVNGVSWRRMTLEKDGFGAGAFAYTFENGRGFRTSSHLARIFTDVWNRSIHGFVDRWVMITVSTSYCDEAKVHDLLGHMKDIVK